MPCETWKKAIDNDVIVEFSTSVDFVTRYTFSTGDDSMDGCILGMIYKMKYCPFCGSELSIHGCEGGENNYVF